MITMALLQKIVADNVAGLELDKNLFCEELPTRPDGTFAEGVWAVSRGGSISNNGIGINLHAIIDFYVALGDRVKIETTHQAISDWAQSNRTICELSGSVGDTSYKLSNIRIRQTRTPQNSGITSNGVLVKVSSLEVYYDSINNKEGGK